jgi:cob(I)alamin adenosyltransferase
MSKAVSDRGYIHIYTGNGKGKTTAALGLAFRAMGRGKRSYIAQFMKGQEYGEVRAAAMVASYITIEQFGEKEPCHTYGTPSEESIKLAQHGLKVAQHAMLSGDFDIIILDEINVAHYYNLLATQDILDFMSRKPCSVELILTGRYAADEFIQEADLVSDVVEIKHYFHKGILARDGIER